MLAEGNTTQKFHLGVSMWSDVKNGIPISEHAKKTDTIFSRLALALLFTRD